MSDDTLPDSGTRAQFETGAVRDAADDKPWLHLISPHFLNRLGHHLRRGAKKYSERNWEKGIPLSRFISSLLRHVAAIQEGGSLEDHEAAVAFNIMGFMHTREMIRRGILPPSLDDLPNYQSVDDLVQNIFHVNNPTHKVTAVDLNKKTVTIENLDPKTFKREHQADFVVSNEPLRIYVAGPFTAKTPAGEDRNVAIAESIGGQLCLLGHDVHIPHSATRNMPRVGHKRFMRLDLGIIRHWANALFFIHPSPGADMELALSTSLGHTIFRDIHDVPRVRDTT